MSSQGHDGLVKALTDLHNAAGRPSARAIARSIGDVSHTTVADALSGRRLPSWQIVSKIVSTLTGHDDLRLRRFRRLWNATQGITESAEETPLVGRADDLADVVGALRSADRSAVFVLGESGSGKSRLLTEVVARVGAADFVVLTGACLDIGDASPLHPVLAALRRADPGFTTDGPDAGALLDRVSRALREVAAGRRLLLVLDDLQWADRSTRQLLLYLLAGLGEVRLSVLAAVRAESLQGTHPLRRVLAELRRLRSVRVVELGPLDRTETVALVRAVAGEAVDPGDADRVFKRSGGNPFVAEELARDLRDGRVELSDTLREIFLARVDELPPQARAVVHAVATGVEPVGQRALAQVLGLPEDELIHAVRVAIAQRLVTGGEDGYRLRHRVVSEILAGEMSPSETAVLHRRHAEAIESGPGTPDPARLVHHWRLAGEPERARPAAISAARAAERLYGFDEAYTYWSTALELTDTASAERPRLLRHVAAAAHSSGRHEQALTSLEELAAREDAPPLPEIHLLRARYLTAAGRSATAETEYRLVLDRPGATASQRTSATAHLAELMLDLGRYGDANALAREALELAEADGSVHDVVCASAALGFSQAFRADPDAGLAVIRQAVVIAEESGHRDDIGVAYLYLAELLTGPLNSLEEGVLVARRGAQRLADLGVARSFRSRLLAIAANGLFRRGEWAECGRILDEAMRHRPSGVDAIELLLARARLLLGTGEREAAERDLDAVATLVADGGARHVLPMLVLRAGLATSSGRYAEARAAVQHGLTDTRSDDLVLLGVLAWHGLRAEAEAHTGGEVPADREAVDRLTVVVERVAAGVGEAAPPPIRAVIDSYLDLCAGELSRLRDASDPEVWARAAEAWDKRSHPYPVAYSRLRQAEAQLHLRRRAAATTALRAAWTTAQSMGAKLLASEVFALATRSQVVLDDTTGTRALLEPDATDDLARLTHREREILAAVAQGLTNREISERMFISERTVGVHVSHIFDKLRVRTRVEASRVFLAGREAVETSGSRPPGDGHSSSPAVR